MNTSRKPKPSSSKKTPIAARDLFASPWSFLGLGFGTGLAPKAPGTFGTLAALPLYALLAGLDAEYYLTATILLFLIGIPICSKTEKVIGIQDHSGVVWDEIVGFLITMSFVVPSAISLALGFILFRFFDVIKPWPIRWFDQRVHGGFGIMLDDAIAGVMACVMTNYGLAHLLQ